MVSITEIYDEKIIFDNEPYYLKVYYGEFESSRKRYKFGCKLESKNNIADKIANPFYITKETFNRRFPELLNESEQELDVEKKHTPPFNRIILFCVKKWLKIFKGIKTEWQNYYNDFSTLPEEIQEKLIIKQDEDFVERKGWNRSIIDNSTFVLVNEFMRYFDNSSFYGIYLSSEYSFAETLSSLEYLQRMKIINRHTNNIQLIPENLDRAANLLNLKISLDTNYLFKNVGIPDHGADEIIFLMMPFGDAKFDFFDKTENGISLRTLIENISKTKCVTVREDTRPLDIVDKIYSHLLECKFAIADIAELNANVFYELGMAHSFNKMVILLCNNKELEEIYNAKDDNSKLPDATKLKNDFLKKVFDVNHKSIIFYDTKEELIEQLEKTIPQILTTLA